MKPKKELKKLRMMSPMSSEANVVRNYLEWLIAMPWDIRTEDNFDLKQAEQILDEDHYGLEKIKERIIEYLAVASPREKLKGPILCLEWSSWCWQNFSCPVCGKRSGKKFCSY